jgi:hypothetical protein
MLPPICCKPVEAPEIGGALLPVQYRRADRIKCRRSDINGLVCSKQKCQSVQMGIAVFIPISTPPTKKYGKQPPSLVSILMPFQASRINTQLHTVPSLSPTSSPLSSTLTLHLLFIPSPPPHPHIPDTISRQRNPIQVGKILKHPRLRCPRIDITNPLTKAITYPEKTSCRISCITI